MTDELPVGSIFALRAIFSSLRLVTSEWTRCADDRTNTLTRHTVRIASRVRPLMGPLMISRPLWTYGTVAPMLTAPKSQLQTRVRARTTLVQDIFTPINVGVEGCGHLGKSGEDPNG